MTQVSKGGNPLSLGSLLQFITGNCLLKINITNRECPNTTTTTELWKNNHLPPPFSLSFLHLLLVLQKHSPEDFLLCDVIGKPIQQPDGAIKWETECRRSVAPWECPLLLVDMWRPRDGYERRFEIQRKDDYEREEREREREREGEQQGMLMFH